MWSKAAKIAQPIHRLLLSYVEVAYPRRPGVPEPSPMNPVQCGSFWPKRFHFLWIAAVMVAALLGTAGFQVFSGHLQESRQIRIRTQKDIVERAAGPKYRPNRVLVRYRQGTTPDAVRALHQQVNATVLREFPLVKGLQVVRIAEGSSVPEALAYYRRNSAVVYAEPDYIVKSVDVPNDPQFSSQWDLQNTGQSEQ
jgi:hypothetical protein